jgi:cytochrome c-type biogenesis protein CcmH
MRPLFIILLFTLTFASQAGVEAREFVSPAQKNDYLSLTNELRCLVCQNQTIADSNADLASDLRRQVYEMLQQGKSKQEIVQFMTDRYGDFVLYNPPFKAKTSLLWLGPVVFLLTGLCFAFMYIKRKKRSDESRLQADEQAMKLAKARDLLEKGDWS